MSPLLILMLFLLLNLICIIISVAFLTLLERKILSYIQYRKGPNKLGLSGILQPFSDALKLLAKEFTYPFSSNQMVFYISPAISFIIALMIWLILPVSSLIMKMSFSVLFFLCCLSLGVYGLLLSGWSSNSKYSLLGSVRSIAQTISYEISLALILLSIMISFSSSNFHFFIESQIMFFSMTYFSFILFILFCSIIAELNRTPFDFSEGESELVSGFNVEYSSYGFTLIFLSEYSNIIFMSSIIIHLFFGSFWSQSTSLKITLMITLIIIIRGLLPRFRYDMLMYLSWKSILPIALMVFPYFLFNKLSMMA